MATKNYNGQLTALMQHNTMPPNRIPQIIDADYAKMPHHFLTLKIFSPHFSFALFFANHRKRQFCISCWHFFSLFSCWVFVVVVVVGVHLLFTHSFTLCCLVHSYSVHLISMLGQIHTFAFLFRIYAVTLLFNICIYAYIWMVTSSPQFGLNRKTGNV